MRHGVVKTNDSLQNAVSIRNAELKILIGLILLATAGYLVYTLLDSAFPTTIFRNPEGKVPMMWFLAALIALLSGAVLLIFRRELAEVVRRNKKGVDVVFGVDVHDDVADLHYKTVPHGMKYGAFPDTVKVLVVFQGGWFQDSAGEIILNLSTCDVVVHTRSPFTIHRVDPYCTDPVNFPVELRSSVCYHTRIRMTLWNALILLHQQVVHGEYIDVEKIIFRYGEMRDNQEKVRAKEDGLEQACFNYSRQISAMEVEHEKALRDLEAKHTAELQSVTTDRDQQVSELGEALVVANNDKLNLVEAAVFAVLQLKKTKRFGRNNPAQSGIDAHEARAKDRGENSAEARAIRHDLTQSILPFLEDDHPVKVSFRKELEEHERASAKKTGGTAQTQPFDKLRDRVLHEVPPG